MTSGLSLNIGKRNNKFYLYFKEREIEHSQRIEIEGSTMKSTKIKTWQHEITGFDGNTILFGVNIFDYEWKSTHKSAKVCDPLYGQEYKFPIYTVIVNGQEQEFAAGEFSNCVWGFYLLKF